MRTLSCLPVLAVLLAPGLSADLRLPAILSDGMVLQRDTETTLWGWAEPGRTIEVEASWNGRTWRTTSDADGRFALRVSTSNPAATAGPHCLSFSGDGEVVLEDILLGEVWIAGGQSNIEWRIASSSLAIPNYEATRDAVSLPRLRFFTVANETALVPSEDCVGNWAACTPETWPSFSAVAYYFGQELLGELDVPIGLVSTNWGGTVCEAWTSAEGLAAFPEFAGAIATAREAAAKGLTSATIVAMDRASFWDRVREKDAGSIGNLYASPSFDDSAWEEVLVPGAWSGEAASFDGIVWYRRRFELPPAWVGRDLVLELGPIDDIDTVYFDGVKVGGLEGGGGWRTPRVYSLPAEKASAGAHLIAVRILDVGGAGGFVGEAKELRLRLSDVSEQRITDGDSLPLAGPWRHRRGASLALLGGYPVSPSFHQNSPTALFNRMIAPLAQLSVRGAIWYQGESNRTRAFQYRTLFPAMIRDWRRVFRHPDMPFYFVQIAPYAYSRDVGQAAELREAQAMALSLPHTGMAVTMDIGNPADIHPRNKWEVGHRLALHALAGTYGRQGIEASGPLWEGMQVEGASIRLTFTHAAGLTSGDGGPLTHFTVAGADRVFHPGRAEVKGEALVVTSEHVSAPIAVRYAWGAADEPNLINGDGLPAPSFRTDRWVRK